MTITVNSSNKYRNQLWKCLQHLNMTVKSVEFATKFKPGNFFCRTWHKNMSCWRKIELGIFFCNLTYITLIILLLDFFQLPTFWPPIESWFLCVLSQSLQNWLTTKYLEGSPYILCTLCTPNDCLIRCSIKYGILMLQQSGQ